MFGLQGGQSDHIPGSATSESPGVPTIPSDNPDGEHGASRLCPPYETLPVFLIACSSASLV